MTLQSSGTNVTMSLKDVNVELGQSATATINLSDASGEFGLSAPHGMDELFGKSDSAPSVDAFAVATNTSTAGRLDLTWTFSVPSGAPAISSIAVKRSVNSDMSSPTTITTNNDGAHSDTGQGNNNTRYYQAAVVNASGTTNSSIINATTLALPAFSSFAAAAGSDSGEIDVSWGTTGTVDSFVVKYSTNSDMSSATNLTTTNDGAETQSSISAATMYYQGTATNDAGSTNSSIVSASPPGTAWSNLTGDPQNLVGVGGGTETSNACSIQLSAGSGNTTIGGATSGGVVGTLFIAYSTSGDPGAGGTSNGGSGFLSIGTRTVSFTSGTLYFRTRFTHTSGKDATGGYTVTFTNNSVANNDMNGTINFGL